MRVKTTLCLFLFGGLLVATLLPSPAVASGTLTVRLVRASRSPGDTDPGLNDVAAALQGSLAFQGYSLVARAGLPLPADGRPLRLHHYTVRCQGAPERLNIRVDQGRQRLLDTNVSLRGTRPLVLGGFPAGRGDLFVLVFVAR